MKYPKLFSPAKIGSMTIKNRIVMCALAMGVSDDKQCIGDDFMQYLLERADGGVGMIVLENTRVDDEHGVAAPKQASLARDEQIAPMAKAVEALHERDVKIFAQLHHPGRETFSNINSNEPVWSSSSKSCGVCQQETHEMTTEEVELVISKFVAAAVRAKKAGCDGVELHAAHGYLISQFFSPYTNQRNDRFGGTFEKRLQFVKEIIEGIQKECGKDYNIGIRISVDELLEPNGVKEYLRLEDGVKICQELEKMGLVYINVSNGIYESFNSLSEPTTYPQGCRSDRIRAVKQAVNIPVIAVNMIKEPWFAEKMDWIIEYELNQLKKLDVTILVNIEATSEIIASYNPYAVLIATGGVPIKPASIPGSDLENAVTFKDVLCDIKPLYGKNVTVIGSGATGLETAEFLCSRNNKVTIVEMLDEIGKGVYVQTYLDCMDKLSQYDITYKPATKLLEIKPGCAVLANETNNETEEYPTDYVVLAMGVKPLNTLEEECKRFCDRVTVIGDAKKIGRIETAVRTGFEAAYTLG